MTLRPLLALLAAGALLAGCGDEAEKAPPSVLVKASEKTAGAGPARVEMELHFDAGIQDFVMTGEGVADQRTQRSRLDLDMSDIAEVAGQDPDDWRGEQYTEGFVSYMRIPALSRQFGADTPWVKLDLDEVNESQGIDLDSFTGSQNDPTQMLRYLRAVSGDVEDLGGEEVDGRDTTHYRATIDLRKYPAAAPPEDRERAAQSVERLVELTGTDEVLSEVWVDDEDLVRRMLMEMSFDVQAVPLDIDIRMDFPEFGVDPGSLAPPPAHQVTDITERASGSSTP